MYTIKCDSCGFELYRERFPKTVEMVSKTWGGVCPKCMSPLSSEPIRISLVRVR